MPSIRHVQNSFSQTTSDTWSLPGTILTKSRGQSIPYPSLYSFVSSCGLYPQHVDLKDVNRIIRVSGLPLVEKHIVRETYRFIHWLHILDGRLDILDNVNRTLAKAVHPELLEVLADLSADLQEISASSFTMFFCLLDLAEEVDQSEIAEFLPGFKSLKSPWTMADLGGPDIGTVLFVLAQAMWDTVSVWREEHRVMATPELVQRIMDLSEKYPGADFEDVLDLFPPLNL